MTEYEKMIYLNKERIRILNSKNYFFGKKISRYLSYFRRFKLISLFRQLLNDFRGLFKKRINRQLYDFEHSNNSSFNGRIAVYTSVFGSYDSIMDPLYIDPNCDYFIFTDQSIPNDSVWKKMPLEKIPDYCNSNVLKNRYVKMFPNIFFDNYEYSIYLDGNLQIVGNISSMITNEFLNYKLGIAMHLHPRNTSIYDEVKSAYFLKKINSKQKKYILKFYKNEKMPKNFGMYECNVIVRKHNLNNCVSIMEEWWKYFKDSPVKRDQLYFTYVLWKNNYNFNDVFSYGDSVDNNYFFIRRIHLEGK